MCSRRIVALLCVVASTGFAPPPTRLRRRTTLVALAPSDGASALDAANTHIALAPSDAAHTLVALAPSGVDALPEPLQAAVFFGAYAALGAGTAATTKVLDGARAALPAGAAELWRGSVEALPLLGALYVAAGVSHFTNADAFRAIYPPPGTWGVWYLPGGAGFHVAWTGFAECAGGLGLLAGGLLTKLEDERPGPLGIPLAGALTSAAAFGLFALTLAVTPANIFMYTHGATMTPGALPVAFHYARFAVQVVILSLLLTLAKESLFYAWGDQLD